MVGGPGASGEQGRHLAEELAEASLERLAHAVHDLRGSAAGTLQDVAGCGRDAAFACCVDCWSRAQRRSQKRAYLFGPSGLWQRKPHSRPCPGLGIGDG